MSEDREGQVRQRAHEIWLREGQPDGQGERHWALAEIEIDAERAAPAKKPAVKKAAELKAAKPAVSKPKAPAKKTAKATVGK